MARRKRIEPARILFRPKGPIDIQRTDAWFNGRNDTSPDINTALVKAGRVRSADINTPRYIAGQSKAVTAEIYYATVLWTDKMLQREQRKRY